VASIGNRVVGQILGMGGTHAGQSSDRVDSWALPWRANTPTE
jgi:hypothetical protein